MNWIRREPSRAIFARLVALGAAMVVVLSCETRLPTAPTGTTVVGPGGTVTKVFNAPTTQIDSPTVGPDTQINIGDSILVKVEGIGVASLSNISLAAYSYRGAADLGNLTVVQRYGTITIPPAGSFRAGLKDTIVHRYLHVVTPIDSTLDSVIVVAITTDSAGRADTVTRRLHPTTGPVLSITSPTTADSASPNVNLAIAATATHPSGIQSLIINIKSDSTWPTKVNVTDTVPFAAGTITAIGNARVLIPANAPAKTAVTVTVTAIAVGGTTRTASLVIHVAAASVSTPRVVETVGARIEIGDSILVHASGNGIKTVGFIAKDTLGNTITTATVAIPSPASNIDTLVRTDSIPLTQRGHHLLFTAFAVDQQNDTGYSVPATQTSASKNVATALADTGLIAYGRTYAIPRPGTIADLVVDSTHQNVFLSNINAGLIEVWQNPTKAFDPNGIRAGSQPWGMTMGANTNDTLFVANSGGTNISRMFVGTTTVSAMHEDSSTFGRIKTRAQFYYNITITRDSAAGTINTVVSGPFSYSDRLEYIAQAKSGRIYFSTLPTSSATAGTMRYVAPPTAAKPAPDPQQVWQYGTISGSSTTEQYVVFNLDSIIITNTNGAGNFLGFYDHPAGQDTGLIARFDADPVRAMDSLAAHGSDVVKVYHLDPTTLALNDTTFVAASGNRNWVAFGQGNTSGAPGKVVAVADSTAVGPNSLSPSVQVTDLVNNASQPVFGLAVDKDGSVVGMHGNSTSLASGQNPYSLRLQGTYPALNGGTGIAFDPLAAGDTTNQANRLVFMSSGNAIQIADIFHYSNRATVCATTGALCGIPLKYSTYGPLRASLPLPSDPTTGPNAVLLKLYALTPNGLVVINLTAADITSQ